MLFSIYDVFYSQNSHQHVSACIPAILKVKPLHNNTTPSTHHIRPLHNNTTPSTHHIKPLHNNTTPSTYHLHTQLQLATSPTRPITTRHIT